MILAIRHLLRAKSLQGSVLWSASYGAQSYSTSITDDYQYIQKSKVKMMHFQAGLPRLPVPNLDKTCQRYLKAQQPLLNDEKFTETQKNVLQFQQGIGKTLQKELKVQDKLNKHTSYITGPWFDMYLKDRRPVVISHTPFMVLEEDPRKGYNTQLLRATNLLCSALRFRNSLRAGILEPDVYHLVPHKSDTQRFRTVMRFIPQQLSFYVAAVIFKAFALDMSQYKNLFNSTRIPRPEKDELFVDPSAKHMLVMKNGHFFVFNVLDRDGNILEPSHLHACMLYIQSDKTPPPEYPVGIITAADRDTCTQLRKQLESLNGEAMKLIDTGMFVLMLDDWKADDLKTTSLNFLCGQAHNRWFDKSFSLICNLDGMTCINFEHSWGDGVAMMRFCNEIHADNLKMPQVHPDSAPANIDPSQYVRRLEIKLNPTLEKAILEIQANHENKVSSINFDSLELETFGKKFCKKHKVSPDAIMQLGFQAAFFRQTGQTVGTYESCSTAAFKHGRTETIRPCTTDTKKFSEALNRRDRPSVSELRELITQCSKTHGVLTAEAVMGQGFDRHLFGLLNIAKQQGIDLPSIYTDPAYFFINHNILSTSTVGTKIMTFGGFAPVVPDGLGIAYGIHDDKLGAMVSSFSATRDGAGFIECLRTTYEEIYDILENSSKAA